MSKIPNNIKKVIEEFTEKTTQLIGNHLKKIILYGSYARGDFNKNSDIDIMILTDFTDKEIVEYRSKIVHIAYDIEYDNDFDITIFQLVKNVDKYNERINVIPFYINVKEEGVIISGWRDNSK